MKKILFAMIVTLSFASCVTEYHNCPTNDKRYFQKIEGSKKPHYKFNKPY
jgi:hypothetical protein